MPSPRVNTSGLATIGGVLAAWELALAFGVVEYDYLPAPSEIALAVVAAAGSGELVAAAVHTVRATAIAWLVAVAVGGGVGLLLGVFRPLRFLFLASIDVLRPLPTIAFVPVAVLALGFATTTEVVVAAIAGIWPMLANTMGGVRSVHQRLDEVAATLRLTPLRRLRSIVLPAAAPMILAGARLALGIVLVVVVVVEMVGNPTGLGYQIVSMQQSLRPNAMFAYVLVVGAIGVALNAVLVRVASGLAGHLVNATGRTS